MDGPPQGIFAEKLEEFRAIRDGKIDDPRSLPLLYDYPPAMIESGCRASSLATLTLELADEYDGELVEG